MALMAVPLPYFTPPEAGGHPVPQVVARTLPETLELETLEPETLEPETPLSHRSGSDVYLISDHIRSDRRESAPKRVG